MNSILLLERCYQSISANNLKLPTGRITVAHYHTSNGRMPEVISWHQHMSTNKMDYGKKHLVLSYNMQISTVVSVWTLTLGWIQTLDPAITSYEQSFNFLVPGSVSVEWFFFSYGHIFLLHVQ